MEGGAGLEEEGVAGEEEVSKFTLIFEGLKHPNKIKICGEV